MTDTPTPHPSPLSGERAREALTSAAAWDAGVRLLGNVTAGEIAAMFDELLGRRDESDIRAREVLAARERIAELTEERDRLRRFAEAVVSPCAWGPSAIGCDDDETIADAAERCDIFKRVPHLQPCHSEECGCDGATELLAFAWADPPTGGTPE